MAPLACAALVLTSLTVPATPASAQAKAAEPILQEVTLAKGPAAMGEPMSLAVLPDRTALHTSRDGRIFATDPVGGTKLAATIPVYTHDEEGLQGIAADPDFASNRWIYLYYAPVLASTPAGDAPSNGTDADFARWQGHNQLSRFTLRPDNTVDLASEKKLLQVTADRGMCCHVGGDIDFDAQGNLYLSTGDDTQPWSSSGYTPIDERDGYSWDFDAQRTAGNTNDLRGKVLRIHPEDDGTYTVPAGNLFAPGTARTRPEIYAMGFRNPFRLSVDKATGTVYVGNYAADAEAADPNRGDGGHQEFERITGPGNFGWPYCQGYNTPYNDYDFATGTSGPKFDCAAPVNESPHNTGLRELPRRSRPGSRTTAACPRRWATAAVRWPARSTASTPAWTRRPSCRKASTASSSPVSSPRTGSRRSPRTATAAPVRSPPSRGPTSTSWTWRWARRARSTCSTTAPAGSTATSTPPCTASRPRRAATARRPR
ncbi:PQQ-dependent sugar dehydrogenase [Phytohabitans flavus]|uniref:PQQ-dependent sugar dehydrogenase n=1 Tax=Phytohabitans flavus TaxID=1076124 RepID=UPI00363ED4D5